MGNESFPRPAGLSSDVIGELVTIQSFRKGPTGSGEIVPDVISKSVGVLKAYSINEWVIHIALDGIDTPLKYNAADMHVEVILVSSLTTGAARRELNAARKATLNELYSFEYRWEDKFFAYAAHNWEEANDLFEQAHGFRPGSEVMMRVDGAPLDIRMPQKYQFDYLWSGNAYTYEAISQADADQQFLNQHGFLPGPGVWSRGTNGVPINV